MGFHPTLLHPCTHVQSAAIVINETWTWGKTPCRYSKRLSGPSAPGHGPKSKAILNLEYVCNAPERMTKERNHVK